MKKKQRQKFNFLILVAQVILLCVIFLRCDCKSTIFDYFDLLSCLIQSEETIDTEMRHQNTNFYFEITKYQTEPQLYYLLNPVLFFDFLCIL